MLSQMSTSVQAVAPTVTVSAEVSLPMFRPSIVTRGRA